MTKLPTLYKYASDGGTQEWDIDVEPKDDGTAVMVITHGRQGGKKQVLREPISSGKNLGKKNETTPLQQAVKEAEARWNKQLERECYGQTVEESKAARLAAPMLAQVYKDHADKVDWSNAFEQPKLDGYRCLAIRTEDSIVLRSRKGVTYDLPHLMSPLKRILTPGQVFDGELYAHGVALNKISSLAARPREESGQLLFHAYDMRIDGKDAPFRERVELLMQLLGRRGVDGISLVPTTPVANEEMLMALQAERIASGFEGSMLRHGVLGYEAGKRSMSLLKVKTFDDAEFVVVGFKEGRGTYAGMAVFNCQTPTGHEFEVTAPGSHEEKRQYFQHAALFVGAHLTVKFAGFTKTDKPVPWHPVAKGFVDRKLPGQ